MTLCDQVTLFGVKSRKLQFGWQMNLKHQVAVKGTESNAFVRRAVKYKCMACIALQTLYILTYAEW